MTCARSDRARRAARATWIALFGLACSEAAVGPPADAVSQDSARPAPQAAAGSEKEDAALREQLEAARARNEELEAQLSWTQHQLSLLAAATRDAAFAEGETPAEAEDETVEENGFDAARLAAGGVEAHRIERLQRAAEAAELKLLELTHEARRDGWLDSGRYRNRRNLLDANVRREIGDEDYDLLLCATGRNNRVVVSGVLPGSAAARAGLQAGDRIERYDDRHVFFGTELQRKVARAEPGRNIPIDLRRGGEVLRIGLPGGPIGVRMKAGRVCPKQVR